MDQEGLPGRSKSFLNGIGHESKMRPVSMLLFLSSLIFKLGCKLRMKEELDPTRYNQLTFDKGAKASK